MCSRAVTAVLEPAWCAHELTEDCLCCLSKLYQNTFLRLFRFEMHSPSKWVAGAGDGLRYLPGLWLAWAPNQWPQNNKELLSQTSLTKV